MRRLFPLMLFLCSLFLNGCGLLQQAQQMVVFSKCEFRLASVDKTTLANIPIQGLTKVSEIKLLDMVKLQSVFAKRSLPLQFNANIEVKNPNSTAAAMNKLAWIIFLDETELSSGLVKDRLEVPAEGGVGAIPLNISLNLVSLLSGKALDSMLNLALNVAGEGTKPTRVTLKVKPAIMVGNQELEYPGYVTVIHEFTAQESKELRQDILNRLDKSLKTQ